MKNSAKLFIVFIMLMNLNNACKNQPETGTGSQDDFKYFVDQFEDIRILKYRLPAFESLTLQQKEYIYYLSQAALAGRDILWDQNFRYNLIVRKTLEGIIESYNGDKNNDEYKAFLTYAKRVFFSNGIHHHYSSDKFKPGFSSEYFSVLLSFFRTKLSAWASAISFTVKG